MNRNMLVLTMLTVTGQAYAGGVLELVPVQVGPYPPGQSISVVVWLHNEESFDIDLQLLGLDALGLRERLFAGGDFVTSGGTTVNHIAKLTGGDWARLGNGFEGNVYALESCTVDLGNTLFAGGRAPNGYQWQPAVSRLEGGWWNEIGRGPSGRTLSLQCVHDGLNQWLYAGGYLWGFEDLGSAGIARWNDTGWGAIEGLNGAVFDMV